VTRDDACDDQSSQEAGPGDAAGVVVGVDRYDSVDPVGEVGRCGEGEYGPHRLAEQGHFAQI
jgi:hypothetical protein